MPPPGGSSFTHGGGLPSLSPSNCVVAFPGVRQRLSSPWFMATALSFPCARWRGANCCHPREAHPSHLGQPPLPLPLQPHRRLPRRPPMTELAVVHGYHPELSLRRVAGCRPPPRTQVRAQESPLHVPLRAQVLPPHAQAHAREPSQAALPHSGYLLSLPALLAGCSPTLTRWGNCSRGPSGQRRR